MEFPKTTTELEMYFMLQDLVEQRKIVERNSIRLDKNSGEIWLEEDFKKKCHEFIKKVSA